MKRIDTTIETDATPAEVWDVLMDFPSYPSWNPMVVEITGERRPGARLAITVAMKDGRRMRFRPTVVEYDEGRCFAWLGTLLLRGIFDGLHRFEIKSRGTTTVFIHSEEFRGLLPPFVGRLMKDIHETVEAMNEALVREAVRRRPLRPVPVVGSTS